MLLLCARFARASTGCASISRSLWNVLLPRYHLRHCLSWPYTQKSRTSPQRRICGVPASGVWYRLRCAAHSVLSRGFLVRLRSRSLCVVLYFWVHSQREMWVPVPHPTGSLTARVLGNSRSAPPHVSVFGCLSSILFASILVLSPLGLRISPRTSSSQQSPMPWLRLAPSATPCYFPMSDARRVYFIDSFVAGGSQLHAHTKSPVLHLLW